MPREQNRNNPLSRRSFLRQMALAPALATISCRRLLEPRSRHGSHPPRFLFVSRGRTAVLNADGSGLCYFDFNVPNQATWQPAAFFSDGCRVLFLSMEPRRDGPGRPFDQYYTQTPTHLWIYDLEHGTLQEIATLERLAVFYTPQLLIGGDRMLVQVVRDQAGQIGAAYGHPKNRGSGSNMPTWTGDGQVLFSRKLPGSKVAWEYQPQRTDVDHFNRDWKPERACGGTEICRLDPSDAKITRLTHSDPPVWDFRPSESPDRAHILFCRAETGGVPAIWVMDREGRGQRLLSRGLDGSGADHPRWLPPD